MITGSLWRRAFIILLDFYIKLFAFRVSGNAVHYC